MGNIARRIEDLERLIKPPQDEGAHLRRAVMRDILDELSRLTSCRSTNSYRGGKPPTPIQPTDPTGDAYGYPYTRGQLVEYAIRRVLGREQDEAPDVLTHEVTEGLIASWSEALRESTAFGEGWDEIEAEEPPGRTQPWRGGS
jgi:hypothetical protein